MQVRNVRTLKHKAVCSLRVAMEAFNSYSEEGRVTCVLLHAQHASEMLLKAVLRQAKLSVFDKATGKSFGFEKCVNICQSRFGLTESEAGIMRSVDRLRDEAQHWFVMVSEEILYVQLRAMITAFDSVLKRSLADDFFSHIPARTLPVSTLPVTDFEYLIDKEYKLIAELLRPGNRKRDEARGRMASLLSLEALVTNDVQVSQKDIDRIEKAIRVGHETGAVFPRLATVATTSSGQGPTLTLKFSKKVGPPVRYIGGDDPEAAAAVREVDLRKKFHMTRSELATALEVTTTVSSALRAHLMIDTDPNCCHVFEFGAQKHPCFSDNARSRISSALADGLDIEELMKKQRANYKKWGKPK